MAKIKRTSFISNDVLLGLMGKACHCEEHDPFIHFNIKPTDTDVDIVLTLNGIEVPGAAGFLDAYYKQIEKMIGKRVRTALNEKEKQTSKASFNDEQPPAAAVVEQDMFWADIEEGPHSDKPLQQSRTNSDDHLKDYEKIIKERIEQK